MLTPVSDGIPCFILFVIEFMLMPKDMTPATSAV